MTEEQKTTITIERPLRVGGVERIDIDVPFNQAEVEAIQNARLAQALLMPHALEGSGISREVAVRLGVPWGYTLVDRSKAIGQITQTIDYIGKQLTPEHERFLRPEEVTLIRKIQTNLASLLQAE